MRDFLISNALFWLEKYHFDGLRVDAVASMLYLDFAREPGEWIPNAHGGNQNHEAVRFLQDLNTSVYAQFPDVHMIAEESTAWPGVSRPVHHGGLGFGMKWNMGWMNDTLRYIVAAALLPALARRRHPLLRRCTPSTRTSSCRCRTTRWCTARAACSARQPGDEWQRFAGLRNLYGYMWAHPGKKLLFMGGEFGQYDEWHHERTLDWHLWARPLHAGLARWVSDLNAAYRRAAGTARATTSTADGFALAAVRTPRADHPHLPAPRRRRRCARGRR